MHSEDQYSAEHVEHSSSWKGRLLQKYGEVFPRQNTVESKNKDRGIKLHENLK